MELQIVNFADEHVAEVSEIEAASYRDPWSENSFREVRILSDTSWVALADGEVAGYLITQWVLDEIHVLNIAVRPDRRQQRIASMLLDMLFTLAQRRGMRDMFLEVRMSNTAAQQTYRKLGFSTLATRKSYYPDGEDALVMYRRLESAQDAREAALDENIGDEHGH
jgi:ribosomal-protein-alanine N-acetyltransferase